MSLKNGKRENFDELISIGKVLVDFYATWCGPCKMLSPIIEQVAKERTDITVVRVNIDQEQTLAMNYNIEAVPTLLVVENGKVVNKSVGFIDKNKVENLLK